MENNLEKQGEKTSVQKTKEVIKKSETGKQIDAKVCNHLEKFV